VSLAAVAVLSAALSAVSRLRIQVSDVAVTRAMPLRVIGSNLTLMSWDLTLGELER